MICVIAHWVLVSIIYFTTQITEKYSTAMCSANPNSCQVQEKVTPRLTDNQSSAPVTIAESCHPTWLHWLVGARSARSGQVRGYRSWYGEHPPDLKSCSHTLPSYKHMSSFPMKLRLKESDSWNFCFIFQKVFPTNFMYVLWRDLL